jgi:hypothetical protein
MHGLMPCGTRQLRSHLPLYFASATPCEGHLLRSSLFRGADRTPEFLVEASQECCRIYDLMTTQWYKPWRRQRGVSIQQTSTPGILRQWRLPSPLSNGATFRISSEA